MSLYGASPETGLPVNQIKTMRAQGMDNNQIIQALQRDGYSSTDIFDAMNQADMSSGNPYNTPPAPIAPGINYSDLPPPERNFPEPGIFNASNSGAPKKNDSYSGDVSTEELVEAIIDEKWNDLVKDISKIVEWKNASNTKIIQLEQQFADLKQEFDKLHGAIISKIDAYDNNISNVGAEVKAMEKVFSKVLPVFTENVSALSKISKDLKRASK